MKANSHRIRHVRLAGLGMIGMMVVGSAVAVERPESVTVFAVEQIDAAVAAGGERQPGVRRPPRDRRGDERLAWISQHERQMREQARTVVCDLRLSPRLHAPSLRDVSVEGPRWSRVSAAEPNSAP